MTWWFGNVIHHDNEVRGSAGEAEQAAVNETNRCTRRHNEFQVRMTLMTILVAVLLGGLLACILHKPLWQGMFARRVRQPAPVPARRPNVFSDSKPPGWSPASRANLSYHGSSRAGPPWLR